MPPRYAYWTILIDQKPTAFRAKEKDELLPTLHQLQRKNADVVMKWFARGRLWDSPEQAQWSDRNLPKPGEKRGREWRPGGEHKDPRARFDKPKRDKRAPSAAPPAGRPFGDRAGKPFGDRTGKPFGDRAGKPFGDRAGKPFGDRAGKPFGDRPGKPFGDRAAKPFVNREGQPPAGNAARPLPSSPTGPWKPRPFESRSPGRPLPGPPGADQRPKPAAQRTENRPFGNRQPGRERPRPFGKPPAGKPPAGKPRGTYRPDRGPRKNRG